MLNPIKKIFTHKKISFFLIVLVSISGYYAYQSLNPPKTQINYTTAAAEIGTLVQSVSGTGQIEALNQIDLKSKVAGDVVAANTASGAAVKAGEIIAAIDDSDAKKAMKDAETAVETAKLALDQMLEPAKELTVMQAEDALETAKEAKTDAEDSLVKAYEDGFNNVGDAFLELPDIMVGLQNIVQGSDSTVVQSSANYLEYYYNSVRNYKESAKYLQDASLSYSKARLAYDKNIADYKSANRFSDEETIVSLIEETYNTTKLISDATKNIANLIQFYKNKMSENNMAAQDFSETQLSNLTVYSSKASGHLTTLLNDRNAIKDAINEISSSERTIREKELALADVNAGADELDIRAQRIAVEQKKAALDEAKETLDDCAIRAPFDGRIASLEVGVGEAVSANAVIASLITDSQVASITLNEVDIARARMGQKATLTFDAIDGLSLTGKVVEIDTVGTVSQGVVSYGVKISLDGQSDLVKSGMSVTASIITQAKQDVLMIPNAAVKTDNNGSYYIEVMNDSGKPLQRSVETGLANDEFTEIVSGLNEGDSVIIGSTAATASKTTTAAGGFNLFGGNRPPGR